MTARLTPGEKRVLRVYCEEETHAKAAARLQISTQTLKNHLGSVYRKLDRHKAHSALYALMKEQGIDLLEEDEPRSISRQETDEATSVG